MVTEYVEDEKEDGEERRKIITYDIKQTKEKHMKRK